jgi:putative DNA primase/helicase
MIATASRLMLAALSYAERGWPVVPLYPIREGRCSCGKSDGDGCSPGKHPIGSLVPRGLKDATIEHETIERWWGKWPDANIGIPTGEASGVLMIGPDGEQGKADLAALEQMHGQLPETPTAASGSGGQHRLFRYPTDGKVTNRQNHCRTKIDVRGAGGYFIAAPSVNGSGPYRWEIDPEETQLADAPEWLLDWCRNKDDASKPRATPASQPHSTDDSPDAERIRDALRHVGGCDGYHEWVEIGMALHAWSPADGFGLWCEWSSGSSKYSEATCLAKWKSFKPGGGVTILTVFKKARNSGWRPPRSEGYRPGTNAGHVGSAPPIGKPKSATISRADGAHLTDVGNGLRFAAEHSEAVRYCPALGWLAWDGRRWKRDEDGTAQELAKLSAKRLYADATRQLNALADSPLSESEKKDRHALILKILAWALKSEDANRIKNCLAMARTDPALVIATEALDCEPFALNCLNGTVDLRTGRVKPHERADLITRLAPVEYLPDAPCPTWLRYLAVVFVADDLISWLQRFVGYCATADVREQIIAILHGGGANGKSVLVEVLLDILGDYAMKANSELLLAGKGDRHETEKAALAGRRFIAAVETGEGRRLNETLVKEASGGDRITARFMRQDHFTFAATFKLVLATNHKPEVRGTDVGIWRRVRLVPFTRRFWKPGEPEGEPELRADPEMRGKLRAEFPGILAWMVRGAVEWHRHGLGTCKAVEVATAEYRQAEDLVGQFVDEECERERREEVRAKELYATYKKWADERNEFALKQKRFGDRLSEMGFERFTNNGTCYRGLRIKTAMELA